MSCGQTRSLYHRVSTARSVSSKDPMLLDEQELPRVALTHSYPILTI